MKKSNDIVLLLASLLDRSTSAVTKSFPIDAKSLECSNRLGQVFGLGRVFVNRSIQISIRRLAVKLFAAFIVVYALADVSVLQAYCGNETVGIPAAEHQPKTDTPNADTHDPKGSNHVDRLNHLPDSQDEEPCSGDQECFGSCSHLVVSRVTVDLSQASSLKVSDKIDSYSGLYSIRIAVSPFHPPKD